MFDVLMVRVRWERALKLWKNTHKPLIPYLLAALTYRLVKRPV